MSLRQEKEIRDNSEDIRDQVLARTRFSNSTYDLKRGFKHFEFDTLMNKFKKLPANVAHLYSASCKK